jgi:hypothetical protein
MLANANLITMWGLRSSRLLILGLFTRLASLAGIAFVLMFYLAAPPWIGYFYAIPTEGSYLIVNKNWSKSPRSPWSSSPAAASIRARSDRARADRPTTRRARRGLSGAGPIGSTGAVQRASFFVQFTATTTGDAVPSTVVFSRNRPSRATAYCGFRPSTLRPEARWTLKSGAGRLSDGAAAVAVNGTAIKVLSGAT